MTYVSKSALFFKDEDDLELSFDAAFEECNNLKFFHVNFVLIKRYIPADDSFILQQLTCELMSNRVAAIFGPSSKASSDIVAQIANSTGIPHLQYDLMVNRPYQQQPYYHMTINVAPTISAVSQAYWEIISNSFEWKSFTLVYETVEGLARLQKVIDVNQINHDFIKLRKFSDYGSDYRVLWKEAAETFHETRFILDCEPENLEKLLLDSLHFNLQGPFKNWFITNLDTHNSELENIYNESFRANISSVRIKTVDKNPYERKKTKLRKADEYWQKQTMLPLLIYDAVVLFTNAAHHVLSSLKNYNEPQIFCNTDGKYGSNWFFGENFIKEMKKISEDDVEPSFKTENMKIDENGYRNSFNLEIYKPTLNEPLAVWKPSGSIKSITVHHQFQSSSIVRDFSQAKKVYTVVTHIEEPYFMLRNDHENFRGMEKYEGYGVDLIQKLSELLDFEYDFIIENGNGKLNPATNEWDGIIRKLIDHDAEIGIADMTITQLRRQVVDFTVPFMQLGISILYYKNPPEPKNIFAFLQPFALEVWIYMILTQLAMTLLFVFMARISFQEWESPHPYNKNPDELESKWNSSNSVWLMIGSIMQQGCDILPRGLPMRILNAMWWFFALMMLSTYTANLAAFLTSNKLQSTIKSLSDLIDQDQVKFGTVRGGSTSLFFSESNHTEYHKAWNHMKSFKPSAFTKNNKEGVERVRKGKGNYAFLMETTSMSYNIERNCDLKEIGSQIGEKHYGLAVPLGADYRSNLSVSILQLSEKGELYKLKNKWWKNHNVTCDKPHEVDGDELSIIELGGVFLVLGGGILVAVIVGFVEFLWNLQRVTVDEKVALIEALKSEIVFALKFWITKKPFRITSMTTKFSADISTASSQQMHYLDRSHNLNSSKSYN